MDIILACCYLSLLTELCDGRSCHQRNMFIEVCKLVLDKYSQAFFKQHFFECALSLCDDPIATVRLRMCPLLPALKGMIRLPGERARLQQLESCVRRLLVNETDRDVVEAIEKVSRYPVKTKHLYNLCTMLDVWPTLNKCYTNYTVNTKHLYNICTMLDQRRRRLAGVVQMLYKLYSKHKTFV